jgi:hypothetical protein
MGTPAAARRSWIALDNRTNTRCIVKSADGPVLARLAAYQLAAVRKRRPTRFDEVTAERVKSLLSGSCCYAFYAKPSHAVKIGLASDVLKRWSELEHRSGMLLQLLMVWKTNDHKSFEKQLHDRFSAYRRLGEWFTGRRSAGRADRRAQRRRTTMTSEKVPRPGHHPRTGNTTDTAPATIKASGHFHAKPAHRQGWPDPRRWPS